MFSHLDDTVFMKLGQPTNWSTFYERKADSRIQDQLFSFLFDGYNQNLKPTFSLNTAVNVTFRLLLYQLLTVNEPHQSLTINAWITETWTDQQLLWDPREFGNITSITVPYNLVWMPDTVLYNTLHMDDEEVRRLLNVRIHAVPKINTALVELMFPTIMDISCRFNVRFFPFDTQNCTLIFGSWTSDSSTIDYYPDILDQQRTLENLIPNEEWQVLSLTASRKRLKFACCPDEWINVEYYLVFKRQPLYYVINLIIPTSIIVTICMVGFFTPTTPQGERSEKVTLGITTLLALAILLLTISDHLPTTSQYVAMIGWYFLSQIVIIALGTVVASFVICIQHKGRNGPAMTDGQYSAIFWLAHLARMSISPAFLRNCKRNTEINVPVASCATKIVIKSASSDESESHRLTWQAVNSDRLMRTDKASSSERDTFQVLDLTKAQNGSVVKLRKLKKKNRRSKYADNRISNPDSADPVAQEWDFAASVIERISLVLFTVLSIFSGLLVLVIGYFFV